MDGTPRVVEGGKPGLAGSLQRCRVLWESPRTAWSLRAMVTAALLALTGLLAVPVADEYEGQQTYRNASVCPADEGDADSDCLVPGTGLITDKVTRKECESLGYGGAEKCGPAYSVQADIRFREEQRTEWFDVSKDTYRRDRRDRFDLYAWHDKVVRITVGDDTVRLGPHFGLRYEPMVWLLGAWFALVIAGVVATGYVWALLTWGGLFLGVSTLVPYFALLVAIEGALFGAGPLWLWILAVIGMAFCSGIVVSGVTREAVSLDRSRVQQT
ncbi:hypothetical protein [Streptomyces sp. 2A115]|uniref:hypothetical protein n=1 Tax=Streptomyces sp. 2A115 TaxID=3457439 RepID=UPI003FCF9866